jgi:hypothetical protein
MKLRKSENFGPAFHAEYDTLTLVYDSTDAVWYEGRAVI